jgi:hypothetical protein
MKGKLNNYELRITNYGLIPARADLQSVRANSTDYKSAPAWTVIHLFINKL